MCEAYADGKFMAAVANYLGILAKCDIFSSVE